MYKNSKRNSFVNLDRKHLKLAQRHLLWYIPMLFLVAFGVHMEFYLGTIISLIALGAHTSLTLNTIFSLRFGKATKLALIVFQPVTSIYMIYKLAIYTRNLREFLEKGRPRTTREF
jgi:hypothetical protein